MKTLVKNLELLSKKLKDAINILKQNDATEKVAELEAILSKLVIQFQETLNTVNESLAKLSVQEKVLYEKPL